MFKLAFRLCLLAGAVWGLSHFAPRLPDMPRVPTADTIPASNPDVANLTRSLATMSSAVTLDASGFCSRKPEACSAGKAIVGQGAKLISAAANSVQGWAQEGERAATPVASVVAPLPMPRP